MENIAINDEDACLVLSPDFGMEVSSPPGEDDEQVPKHVRVLAAFAVLLKDENFRDEILARAFPN
jgi:hypothetical protein